MRLPCIHSAETVDNSHHSTTVMVNFMRSRISNFKFCPDIQDI